ncbi:MAG: hypothetical protein E4G94_00115, partial [ANME-2 cluster archaeon]
LNTDHIIVEIHTTAGNISWRDQGSNAGYYPNILRRGLPITLFAQGNDDSCLDSAILATNESGVWANKTSMYLGCTDDWTWSNFTWNNISIENGTVVGWRIYYNNSGGLINVTDIMTFTVIEDINFPTKVWTIPAEYMVNPTGWGGISSPGSHRTINITAAPLDSTGHYIKGLAPLEAKIYDPSDSLVGTVTLSGTGPYNGTYLLDDGAINGMYSIKITSYPELFGSFSVLRWSCRNCHSDSGRYQTTFDNVTVHPQHDDTRHSTGCLSCHYDPFDGIGYHDPVSMKVSHAYKNNNLCSPACHDGGGSEALHISRQSCTNSCHKPDPGLTCNECHNDISNSSDTSGTSVLSPIFGKDVHYLQKNCPDCHGGLTSINSTPACTDCHPVAGSNLTDYPIPNSIRSTVHSPDQNVSCGLCHSTAHDVHRLSINSCIECHVNLPHEIFPTPCTSCHGIDPHEIKAGAGSDCISCHNKNSDFVHETKRVNMTAFNDSVHYNITDNANINTNCWACHSTTGAEPDGHPDRYNNPWQCLDCHVNANSPSYWKLSGYGNASGLSPAYDNATKVVRHVPGSYFGQNSQKYYPTSSSSDCLACHQNSQADHNAIYAESYQYKNEANISHYATTTDLENTTSGQTCEDCHIEAYSLYDTPVQIDTALHGKGRSCQSSCHNKLWASSLYSSVHDSTNEIDPIFSCFSGEAGCHPGLVY